MPLSLHRTPALLRNIYRTSISTTCLQLSTPTIHLKTPSITNPYTTMAPTPPSALTSGPTPIVISGPSGSGKSTILTRLFKEYPSKFGFSISHTTRAPRAGEQNGREYHFVTPETFASLVESSSFVEHATFSGNSYGTSIAAISAIAEQNKTCILDIEMEGVKQVANHPTFPRPKFLFLAPPSLEVLEERLRGRGTDGEDAVRKRLEQARREMEWARSGEAPHDRVVVNEDLEKAYGEVREFVLGEEKKD
ncbi:guanylate kinase [Dendryphion nanum]|uniref:Guanylate kinase n=1 Tax=Dendryphion nanum TaxID=256645 RepID=A0A9P9IME7_9PLEO|nr:guanylate kinase [Dendryphion nanum]